MLGVGPVNIETYLHCTVFLEPCSSTEELSANKPIIELRG
jgi:hypothetical protein